MKKKISVSDFERVIPGSRWEMFWLPFGNGESLVIGELGHSGKIFVINYILNGSFRGFPGEEYASVEESKAAAVKLWNSGEIQREFPPRSKEKSKRYD